MFIYCKAYRLSRAAHVSKLARKSSGWRSPADDTICYMRDDFKVVTNPIHEDSILFDQITPEWQIFCTSQLHFVLPTDILRGNNGE